MTSKKGPLEKLLNKCKCELKLKNKGTWCSALSAKERGHKNPGNMYDVYYKGGRFNFSGGWSREEAAALFMQCCIDAYFSMLKTHVSLRYLENKTNDDK